MQRLTNRLIRIGSVLVLIALLSVSAFAAADGAAEAVNPYYATFWSLMPPLVAIALALITKEVYSSLFIGVVMGALLNCEFAPVATLDMVVNDGIITAISDNAGIFLFLVLLGTIVALVNVSGGSAAFGSWAEKNIKKL